MSGAAWALVSGLGFGLFQAVNGRATRDLGDSWPAGLLQFSTAFAVMLGLAVASGEAGELVGAPPRALLSFAAAGIIHFTAGWLLLDASHREIGAARTSPLLSTSPLFGLALAAVAYDQWPGPIGLAGVLLTVVGAAVVTGLFGRGRLTLTQTRFALGTAAVWALSALFTLDGLDLVDAPLAGVAVGMGAATVAYLATYPFRRRGPIRPLTAAALRVALAFKLAAAVAVALATWGRYLALDGADVAVVLALQLISVPVVFVVAPLLSGRRHEPVTLTLWLGATLIGAGTLALVLSQ